VIQPSKLRVPVNILKKYLLKPETLVMIPSKKNDDDEDYIFPYSFEDIIEDTSVTFVDVYIEQFIELKKEIPISEFKNFTIIFS